MDNATTKQKRGKVQLGSRRMIPEEVAEFVGSSGKQMATVINVLDDGEFIGQSTFRMFYVDCKGAPETEGMYRYENGSLNRMGEDEDPDSVPPNSLLQVTKLAADAVKNRQGPLLLIIGKKGLVLGRCVSGDRDRIAFVENGSNRTAIEDTLRS